MEYRIKMIQKNNGENLFIPQYRSGNNYRMMILGIILSPIMLLYCICNGTPQLLIDWFTSWENIYYKETFMEGNQLFNKDTSAISNNKAHAEAIIKSHKQDLENKFKKEKEEKYNVEMNKIKKVLYIKIK